MDRLYDRKHIKSVLLIIVMMLLCSFITPVTAMAKVKDGVYEFGVNYGADTFKCKITKSKIIIPKKAKTSFAYFKSLKANASKRKKNH